MKSHEEQELHAQVEEVRGRLQDLTADLRVIDDELDSLAQQRWARLAATVPSLHLLQFS